jgi:hypothetical protein
MTVTITMESISLTHSNEGKPLKNQIDMKIMEAIDESLASFGDKVRQIVYFHMQSNHNVPKQEIPTKIEELAKALEAIFGIGARLIEMKIIQKLHSKTNGFLYVPKDEDFNLKDYVQNLRCFWSAP